MFCLKAHYSPKYQNHRGKISRDRNCSKLIGCSAVCVHFFNCVNIENALIEFRYFNSECVQKIFFVF